MLITDVINVLTNRLNNNLVLNLWVLVNFITIVSVALLKETLFTTIRPHRHNLFDFRCILPRTTLGLHIVFNVFDDLSDVSGKLVDFARFAHVIYVGGVKFAAAVRSGKLFILAIALFFLLFGQVLVVGISAAYSTTSRVAHQLELSLPVLIDEHFVVLTEDRLNPRDNRRGVNNESNEFNNGLAEHVVAGIIDDVPFLVTIGGRGVRNNSVDLENRHDLLLVALDVLLQIEERVFDGRL